MKGLILAFRGVYVGIFVFCGFLVNIIMLQRMLNLAFSLILDFICLLEFPYILIVVVFLSSFF